jgi:glycosyltransferase involved in cell wall biosynthesis
MNILIVSGQWTTEPRAGGVQSNVCTLVDVLAKRHAVSVFMPSWPDKQLTCKQVGTISVYRRRLRFPAGRKLVATRRFLAWLGTLPRTLADLRRVFREQQTEVIHLHQLQPDQLTFAVARLLGSPPYVATFHGRDVRDYKSRNWIERCAIRYIVRHASGLTAVSQDLATLAEGAIPGVKDVKVIRNGVKLGDMKAEEATPDGMPAKYFLAVGRLYPLQGYPLKGQDLLIRAWSKLRVAKPDLHLLLVGADKEGKEYRALAESLGASHHVHILGSLPRQQLLGIMSRAIGVVTASRSEGGGPTMTILESGFLARPLVASSIPAHAECLRDGVDCLLVAPEDPDGIAAAVARLVDDPALADSLGQALHRKVMDFSSAEQMSEGYARLAYSPALSPTTRLAHG